MIIFYKIRCPGRAATLLLGLLLALPAVGATVDGLYESEVPVAGQAAALRNTALQTALREVLIRVTGDPAAVLHPEIRLVIQAADRFVEQYRYTRRRSGVGSEGLPALILWVRFDSALLNSRIRAAGLPVWGRVRPATLLWLAVASDQAQFMVSAEEYPKLDAVIAAQALRRGVPVILPLLDLEDRSRVLYSDLRGGFTDSVAAASQRYGTEAIVSGALLQILPGLWEGRWTMTVDERAMSWRSDGISLAAVLEELIDDIATRLAANYAPAGGSAQSSYVELTVTGVRSVGDYARSLAYLEALEPVLKAHVARLSKGEVVYQIWVRGSTTALDQAIALGRTLLLRGDAFDMRYELLP